MGKVENDEEWEAIGGWWMQRKKKKCPRLLIDKVEVEERNMK